MDVALFREIWAGHTDTGVDSEHVVFIAVDFHKTTEAGVNSWKKETSGILVKGRTLRKCERASVYETWVRAWPGCKDTAGGVRGQFSKSFVYWAKKSEAFPKVMESLRGLEAPEWLEYIVENTLEGQGGVGTGGGSREEGDQ